MGLCGFNRRRRKIARRRLRRINRRRREQEEARLAALEEEKTKLSEEPEVVVVEATADSEAEASRTVTEDLTPVNVSDYAFVAEKHEDPSPLEAFNSFDSSEVQSTFTEEERPKKRQVKRTVRKTRTAKRKTTKKK